METKSEVAAIIPSTTLQEVIRTLTDDVTEVDVLFDETQVRFRVGESEITSRLIDGNYPDYRQLIPATSETNIVIDANEFVRITKIAGLFARDSGGSVTLTADKEAQTLAVRSIASEYGENTSNTPAQVTSDGMVTLNSRYLSDALSVVNGSTVEFRFNGKLAPCVLTAKADDINYKHIIMPLKS
jgi:DNA polymerase-3 subunit beta